MEEPYVKKFLRRFIGVKIPPHLSIIISIIVSTIVWGSTVYFLCHRSTLGKVNVIGVRVGVYWDANGDNPIKTLSWGNITVYPLRPEFSKNVTIYIRNLGNKIIVLQLNTSDWQPIMVNKYISISWDYDGRRLGTKEIVKVTLFLTVNSNIWFSPFVFWGLRNSISNILLFRSS